MTEDKPGYGKITGKGQITIPKAIREALGVKYGDRVDFVERDGVIVLKKHFDAEAFEAALDEWAGYLKHLKGRTSDELVAEMRDG